MTTGVSLLPCFVVMRITPFAPCEPYIAVAEASLRISIEAISCGEIEARGLDAVIFELPDDVPEPIGSLSVSVSIIFPSTTYSGWLSPRRDDVPRIWMLTAPPGAELPVVTCTPAALPSSIWSNDIERALSSASGVTEVSDPVRSLFFIVP